MNAYVVENGRHQWLLLGEGTRYEATVSGQWLKTTDPVPVRQ